LVTTVTPNSCFGTKLLRGFFLPKGAPQNAADELSKAFLSAKDDPAFLE